MGEQGAERVTCQHHHFTQIQNEPNERSSQRVEESNKHLLLCLDTQRLRFCFGSEFGRYRAHESRIERKLAKDGANLAKGDGRLVELEINQVVIAIDLVAQAGNGRELMIQLQDLVQIAKTCGVNFQFEHPASNYERHKFDAKRNTGLRGSQS